MKSSHILILVCVALGALVWIDNFGFETPWSAAPAVSPSAERSVPPVIQGHDTPADEKRAVPASEARPATGNPLASVDKAALSETVMRPLFAPSRSRPPEVVAERVEIAPPPPPPPPSFALLGVVRIGGRAIALLRQVTDGTSFRVEVGDTIGGWQVAGVEATSIRLERPDGMSRTVHLREDKPPAKPRSDQSVEAPP
jgi:hypothetical protein